MGNKTKTVTTDNSKPSHLAVPSRREAQQAFLDSLSDSQKEKQVTSNFLEMADIVLKGYQSVSANDLVFLSKYRNNDPQQIQKLFALWAAKMVELGQLQKVKESCYDYDVFLNPFV